MSGNNIKVVVRCRPLNAREKARGAHCLIRMEGNKTVISKPPAPGSKVLEDPKAFTFDESYWSADKNDPDYADQEKVYNDLGREVLDHAFNGYNCCIFAYGQTGSGKSYSMVGYGEEKGIIPRTCSELFDRVKQNKSETMDFQVEVSYIEIYNEKVRDLLNPRNGNNLKVREHPVLGPYVQDLSRLAVDSYKNLDQLMDEGNKARTVAATNMNETSSRSHAVFMIFVTQKILDPATKQVTEKVARISLVDLAGSERANSTGATGVRLKEGANINKSLTTLGKVIAGLAEQANSSDKKSKKSKEAFIPFRDSVLTWLLKDSLGGNSKTCMIAAISPADYDETLSTLRYADQAKKIKTKAVINEDPSVKMMRELKDEVEALRQALMVYAPAEVEKIAATAHPVKGQPKQASKPTALTDAAAKSVSPPTTKSTVVFTDASGNTTQLTKEEMVEQLQTSEKLLSDLNQTWEEKLQKTEEVHVEREKALKNLGITIEKNQVGLYTPKEIPYLINLNEDPLMSECLMYNIKSGLTYVDQFVDTDSEAKDVPNDISYIRLSGSNINNNHCYFENKDNVVTLYPRAGCTTMVNGMRITEPKRLKSGYRVILGDYHVFRFNNPGEALKEREIVQQQSQETIDTTQIAGSPATPPSPISSDRELTTPPPPIGSEIMDWNFARREAMLNTYIHDSSFENFSNEDLDKLFDDVAKIRILRKRQSSSSDTLSRRTSMSSSVRRSVYSTTASSVFLDDGVDSFYTTDTSTVSSTSSAGESLFMLSKDEQELHLEHHRLKYEAKLRRLSRHLSYTQPPPLTFTPKEKLLVTKVAEQWKRQRNVAMAKTILTYDMYLRQANALSAKANKDVTYQFAVVHDNSSVMAVSHWDTTSSTTQQPKSTIDADLIKSPKPCVAVQVIDRKNQALYLWSVEKFMARLRYLQGSYFVSDSKKYIKGDDLFYESAIPNFTLIGFAQVPLSNLMTQVPVESSLSVYCRSTGRSKGELKVLITPIARSVRQPSSDEASYSAEDEAILDDENPRKLLHVGQQLVFEISIIELSGLDPKEFSRVHAQFRLSAFGDHLDGVFASDPVDYTKESAIAINYHQTLSMAITEDILSAIETKDITFEVYGKPNKNYLQGIASASMSDSSTDHDIVKSILPSKKPDDVIARFQICEITSTGDYKPVPVESSQADILGQHDVFSLQQGQQRRIVLSLASTAAFDKIIDARIGQVRLVDAKHRVVDSSHNSPTEIPLNITSTKDGVAYLSWDSSLHDTNLLNGITPPHQKVALTLSFSVRQKMLVNGSEVDCTLKLEKDLFVSIKDQSRAINMKRKSSSPKRASIILNFFSIKPSNIKHQVTALYRIEYQPELLGSFLDLPMLELPARILREYHESRRVREQNELKDTVKYSLYLAEQLERLCGPLEPAPTSKLDSQTVIDLWQKKTETTIFNTPAVETSVKPAVRRWIPQVHQVVIPINEEVKLKKGFLLRKNDTATNEWDKYWCVLAGHHLFLYPDQFEVNEVDILNIRNTHKQDKAADIMKSKTLFTVDTLYDSHTFQAPDNTTMLEWLSMFD